MIVLGEGIVDRQPKLMGWIMRREFHRREEPGHIGPEHLGEQGSQREGTKHSEQ
jgi:hypothetical protein